MYDKFIAKWSAFIYSHAGKIAIVSLLLSIAGAYYTAQLGIKSDFSYLLPANTQSVKDLEAISKRMGGMGTLIVYVEGGDLKSMQKFADDIAAKVRTYPANEVRFVDYKIDKQKEFFDSNKFLYPSKEDLIKMRDSINKRIKKEKLKAAGLDLGLDDEEEKKAKAAKPEEKDDFDKKLDELKEEQSKFDRFIDGYLTNKEGTSLIVVIKTPGMSTGVEFAKKIAAKVQADIDALNPSKYHPTLKASLTGDLTTLVEEYYALRDDILIVSNICVALVVLALLIYYRSFRMTFILGSGLFAGILVTFGITSLHIGYLTASTSFLSSIVAGNGINSGIYFLARYMEERRAGQPVNYTLERTLRGVTVPILTAALSAGTAYASLMFVDFRGFNQFGFIGGVGMAICLSFALLLDPALVVLVERYFPFKTEKLQKGERGRFFSAGLSFIVDKARKPILAFCAVAVVVSVFLIAFFISDPFEYNFKKLRNQYSRTSGSGALSNKAEKILGERSSPHVILADNPDQAKQIKASLEKYLIKNDPQNGLIQNIKTVHDSIPGSEAEQLEKIEILKDIRKIILKNKFDFLSPERKKLLDDMTPPENLKPASIESLPKEIVRIYTEENGSVGTQVYIYMSDKMSVWNGHDLQKFAAAVRTVKLDGGVEVRSSGHSVIFSDMLSYIATEGPKATLISFMLVLLLTIAIFRNFRHSAILTLCMSASVLVMMGAAILFKQKINFLNYIAIPIQFGIGMDYAVNMYSRITEDGYDNALKSLKSAGGAVMMTALTTIIGYSAMWFSMNGAINTFATFANIGEFSALFIALLAMPSAVLVFNARKKRGGKAA